MGGKLANRWLFPRIIAKTNNKNEWDVLSLTIYLLTNIPTTVSLPHAMRGQGITSRLNTVILTRHYIHVHALWVVNKQDHMYSNSIIAQYPNYYHVQTTLKMEYKDIHHWQAVTMIGYGKELYTNRR